MWQILNKLKETLHIHFLPIAELPVLEFLYSTAACAVWSPGESFNTLKKADKS